MIFIALFGGIFFTIIVLSFYDSYNLSKIKSYYENNKCISYYEHQGIFKGVCKKSIIVIKNSFSPDLENPTSNIKYDSIKSIKLLNKQKTQVNYKQHLIVLTLKDNSKKIIKFKDEIRLNDFKLSLDKNLESKKEK